MFQEILLQDVSSAAYEITPGRRWSEGQMQSNQASETEAAIDPEEETGAVYLRGMRLCLLLSQEDAVSLHEKTPQQRSRHS